MKLPPLAAFRVFNIAAQTESFVKAAEQLHVTHGAVSRQIKILEETLGTLLFERRNRAVFLTPAGRVLRSTTLTIFEQLEGALHRIRQQAHENVLVLSCEPTIAMKWLIPRLPIFQLAHPDIQLHLSAAGGQIDFQRAGVDLALRRDDFKWDSDIHAIKICDEWVGPVSKPDNVWSFEAEPLLLHTKSRPLAWKNWSSVNGISISGARRVDYEHFYLCIQAAVAGLGVAIASFFMIQDELTTGHLVAPRGFKRDGSAYYLLSPYPMHEDTKNFRFVTWILNEMQKCIAPMSD